METVLIIEDEEDLCRLLAKHLASAGFQASWTVDATEALDLVKKLNPSVVLLDLMLGPYDGLEVLRDIRGIDDTLPVIILTANGSAQTAVQAMKGGAYYYLVKPWDIHELKILLNKAIEDRRLRGELNELQKRISESELLLRNFVDAAEKEISKPSGHIQLSEIARQATHYLEKRLILDALVKSHWHRGNAAVLLGIDPKTLYNKIKDYNLPDV